MVVASEAVLDAEWASEAAHAEAQKARASADLSKKDISRVEHAWALAARVAEAEAEKRAAGENLTNMEKEAQSLEELQDELKERGATLKVRRAEVDSVAAEEVPRAKHELSLYAHISKISWQYEVTDRIKGRVNAHEGKDLKVIDFVMNDRSDYHVTNDLWNMIG